MFFDINNLLINKLYADLPMEKTKYRANIAELEGSNRLGEEIIFKKGRIKLKSNCSGTFANVTGQEAFFLDTDRFPQVNKPDSVPYYADRLYLPGDRPGYIGRKCFETYIASLKELNKKKRNMFENCLVVFYRNGEGARPIHFHSALFLGEENGEGVIFQQNGRGGVFSFTTVERYEIGMMKKYGAVDVKYFKI